MKADYKSLSLANQVYDIIESKILNGVYPPGEILSESRLSDEMGVSRTPVREALAKLVNEKLVTQTSSGTAVLGITAKDADDMYCVKSFLEPMVCRLAARNRSDEQLARMKDILDQQEFYTEKGNMEKVKRPGHGFPRCDVRILRQSDLRVYPFLGAPQTEKVPQGIPQYQRQEQPGNDRAHGHIRGHQGPGRRAGRKTCRRTCKKRLC